MTEIIWPQNCSQSWRNDFSLRYSIYRIYYFRTISSIAVDFKTVCINYNQQRYFHALKSFEYQLSFSIRIVWYNKF